MESRLLESQDLIRDVMSNAMGIYVAEEPKKRDTWRETSQWTLMQHLKHEIAEIERSGTHDIYYHNCLDAINLLAMLAANTRLASKRIRESVNEVLTDVGKD